MSRQFSSALMFVSLVAIALAFNQAENDQATGLGARRSVASADAIHKELVLGTFKPTAELRHTEKLRGPIEVRLESASPRGETFALRGVISTKQGLIDVEYTWSVPDGLEVVRGQLKGRVAALSAEQPAQLEITLRVVGTGNQQVHLLAGATRGGVHFAESAQYNTKSKPALDAVHEDGEELKVFH